MSEGWSSPSADKCSQLSETLRSRQATKGVGARNSDVGVHQLIYPPILGSVYRILNRFLAPLARIAGELNGLGHAVGASTVWRILKDQGIDPAPPRSTVTWTQFLRCQAAVACDFATALLRRYYLLFLAGITANPTGQLTTQAARNLFLRHQERFTDARALVRDRGSQFIDAFDEIRHNSESSDPPDATGSSANAQMPPNQPRRNFGHP